MSGKKTEKPTEIFDRLQASSVCSGAVCPSPDHYHAASCLSSYSVQEALSSGLMPSSLCASMQEYCAVLGLFGFPSGPENAASWIPRLFKSLKPHRFAHSLAVAHTAKHVANRFGLNLQQAEQAGLLHDCAKNLSLSEMQSIARKHHLTEDKSFLASGALLHSIVGAQVARDQFGMQDPVVLEAIAFHNTGNPGMSRLAMCVCLADFIEPNREPFPILEKTRHLAESSLEGALLLSLEATAQYVRSRGQKLHPRTLDTIAWLKSITLSHSSE